jgi:hypothetical protein
MNTYKKAKTELEPLKTSHRNRRYTPSLTCPKGLQTSIKIILRDVKRKIGFLKGITDYSFPCIILQKVKSENRLYELSHMKKMEYCLPYEEIEREAKAIDLMKAKSLSETLKMSKCNIKEQ